MRLFKKRKSVPEINRLTETVIVFGTEMVLVQFEHRVGTWDGRETITLELEDHASYTQRNLDRT